MKKFRFIIILALIIPIAFTFVGCKKKKTENNSSSTTYYISYYLDGGTNNSKNPNSYTSDGGDVSLFDAERKGYNFLGWYTNKNLTGQIRTISANTGKNIILYAGWTPRTYNVTFEYNGATTKNGYDSKNIEFGSKFGTLPVPEKQAEGAIYTFLGWYYGNTKIEENTVFSYFSDVTINARWDEYIIPKKTYNVGFNYNDGSDIVNQEVTEGDTLVKPSNPEKDGYTFGGWFVDGEEWNFDNEITSNMTLVAKWIIKTYNITYHIEDDAVNSEHNPNTYTIEDEDIELEEPVRIGHTFVSWYSNKALTKPIQKIEKGSYGDIDLYDKWTINTYKISFNYDGATNQNSEESRDVNYGDTIGKLPTPEKQLGETQFEFLWWQLVLENSSETVIISEDTVYNFTEDITLIAIWKEIDNPVYFDVSFNSNGGTEIDTQSVEQGTCADKPENPNKRGFEFDKWMHGEDEWNFEENIVTENITLTAVYTAIEYDINYELDNGNNNEANPSKYTISEKNIVLADPEREGYEFVGWFLDSDRTEETTGINAGEIGNKTFYAKWNKIVLVTVRVHYNIPELLSFEYKNYNDFEEQVKFGTEYALPKNNLTNSEFFDAFYTIEGDKKNYILDDSISISSGNDIDIYGGWKSSKIDDIYSNVNLSFEYYYDEETDTTGATVTGYDGNTSSIIIIPKACSIDGNYLTVMKIGDFCFQGKTALSKVILNCNDVEIGKNAFDNTILKEIDFSKIKKIGEYAFRNTNLESITLGDNIKNISAYAFQNNQKLTKVDFSNLCSDIEKISDYMFYNCQNLSEILLNKSISQIGVSAFEKCVKIDNSIFESIMESMSDSSITIGNRAFAGCTPPTNVEGDTLTEVTIPEKVSKVGTGIFEGCSKLVKISLSDFYTTYKNQPFREIFGDNSINEVIIFGTSTSEIPIRYFYNDQKIVTINMENSGIKTFGKEVFKNCSSLVNVVFSDVIDWEKFDLSAFEGSYWKKNFSEMIIKNNSVVYIPSTIKNVEIPEGITSIGGNASSNNKNIISLQIPASVKVIGKSAFEHCEKLETVTFAKNGELTTIESNAFNACYKLESINLGDCPSLDKIGDEAFMYMGNAFIDLENQNQSTFYNQFRLPTNISYIGESAFAYSNIGQFYSRGTKYVSNEKGILFEKNEEGEYVGLVAYPIAISDFVYELPSTVSKIYSGAIAKNKMQYIYIKKNVTIYGNAFAENPDCVIVKANSNVTVTLDKSSGNPTEQYVVNIVPESKNEEYGIYYYEVGNGYGIHISDEILTNTKTVYLVTCNGNKYLVVYGSDKVINFALMVNGIIS